MDQERNILYSTDCPKCRILKTKLSAKNVDYVVHSDVEEMQKIGIEQVPVLVVSGEQMDFTTAVRWVNGQ